MPLISGRIGGPYELAPPVVPVRTFFCRSRTRYLLALGLLLGFFGELGLLELGEIFGGHLHDLAALEPALESAAKFRELVLAAVAADVGRGGEKDPPTDPTVIFAGMLQRLETDPLWAREYEDFVAAVSFGDAKSQIGFLVALNACSRLVAKATTRIS